MRHISFTGLRTPLILSLLVLMLLTQLTFVTGSVSSSKSSPVQISDIGSLSFENILEHVETLSGFGSRVVGYDGFFEAADYIKAYWSSLGFEVREEKFDMVTPIVEDCSIKVETGDGTILEFEAYPLWPNHVNPCPYTSPEEGDRLIYVEGGIPEDFDGSNPKEAFVLMEFNNRWYWKNAALFGAKGIIFLEPEETTGIQAIQKVFSIPINFPRLYVRGQTASYLKNLVKQRGEVKIWVNSKMKWEQKKVSNIIAVIEGSNPDTRDKVAVIGAYYDSWSIVPQLSPGATDSIGISFLLELGRLLKDTPPERTVWLVAFAGHYQGLAGGREFMEKHFDELASKLEMMLSVDLASESDILAVYATGSMYGYLQPQTLLARYSRWLGDIFSKWKPAIESAMGEEYHVINGVTWSDPNWIRSSRPFEPFPIYFEAEIFTEACYGGGLGFVTTNTFKIYQYTPLDTVDKLIQDNIRKQVSFLWPILYNCVNMEVTYFLAPKRIATDWGLITLTIQLATYDKITDWFRSYYHEDAIFLVSVSGISSSQQQVVYAGFSAPSSIGSLRSAVVQGVTVGLFASSSGVSQGQVQQGSLATPLGFTMVAKPDAQGQVVIKGIRPLTGIDVQAYVIDPETGKILCATDTGPFGTTKLRYGGLFGQAAAAAAPTLTAGMEALVYLAASGEGARSFNLFAPPWWRYVPIINVSSIAILGLIDPVNIKDAAGLTLEVYNFISHSYLIWRDTLSPWPETMAFIQPDVPVEILIKSGGRIVAILNNASSKYPEGQGYLLKHGETKILTMFDAVDSVFYLAQARAGFLMERMSANPKLVLHLEKMNSFRKASEEDLQNGKLGEFYSLSIACWQYALHAYLSSFELTYDVVNTASFFFFLSAAFIILVARLIARREAGVKRMMYIIALFLVVNVLLGLIHPGYAISSNIWMLINGLAIILFSILLVYVVIDEFNDAVKSISQSILGYHKSDIERNSFIFSAFSIGVENLKKRYIRTALTLSTIIITVLAMTMFTTMGLVVTSYKTELGTMPAYTGFLIKKPLPDIINVPLSELYMMGINDIASQGLGEFQACPRTWIYPPGMKMFVTWANATKSSIRAILGITPEEAKLLEPALSSGTTFMEGAERVALVSSGLASQLSEDLGIEVKVGTSISVYGMPVTVVGILDDELSKSVFKDLDGGDFVPLNPTSSLTSGAPVYLDVKEVLIVPYDFARNIFNAQPNIIVLHSGTSIKTEDLGQRAYDLALILPFDIFFGSMQHESSGKVATRDVYLISGTENMLVPLTISALTILSMMLSAVYERTKEITTLSTLGLSPRHIGSIFLIESIALAFIGSFIGYITGAGVMTLLWRLNMFPKELIPNVSSGVIIIVMGVIILVTVLSSVYPIVRASKLATPSLLRKWQIGSKPVEDRWSVALPFNATTSETLGVLEFLAEYFEASSSTSGRAGLFILLKPAEIIQEDNRKILKVQLQLSPFDAGIIQNLEVVCQRIGTDRYGFGILINRLLGTENLWVTANKNLLSELRKQFLFWRALGVSDKAKYIERGERRQSTSKE